MLVFHSETTNAVLSSQRDTFIVSYICYNNGRLSIELTVIELG